MTNITINLAIISVDLTNGTVYILSLNENKLELPSEYLTEDNNIQSILYKQLNYVDLSPKWVTTRLTQCIDDLWPTEFTVLYTANIPYDTNLKNGACWLPIEKCVDNNITTYILNNI